MGTRRLGRELAVQALYQMEVTGDLEGPGEVFWRHFDREGPEVVGFAQELVAGVREHRSRIDEAVRAATEHWRLDRIAVVDRCVLRLAAYELLARSDIPMAVTLDEAIEIARRFGGPDSAAFVNGVLDRVAGLVGAAGAGGEDRGGD